MTLRAGEKDALGFDVDWRTKFELGAPRLPESTILIEVWGRPRFGADVLVGSGKVELEELARSAAANAESASPFDVSGDGAEGDPWGVTVQVPIELSAALRASSRRQRRRSRELQLAREDSRSGSGTTHGTSRMDEIGVEEENEESSALRRTPAVLLRLSLSPPIDITDAAEVPASISSTPFALRSMANEFMSGRFSKGARLPPIAFEAMALMLRTARSLCAASDEAAAAAGANPRASSLSPLQDVGRDALSDDSEGAAVAAGDVATAAATSPIPKTDGGEEGTGFDFDGVQRSRAGSRTALRRSAARGACVDILARAVSGELDTIESEWRIMWGEAQELSSSELSGAAEVSRALTKASLLCMKDGAVATAVAARRAGGADARVGVLLNLLTYLQTSVAAMLDLQEVFAQPLLFAASTGKVDAETNSRLVRKEGTAEATASPGNDASGIASNVAGLRAVSLFITVTFRAISADNLTRSPSYIII